MAILVGDIGGTHTRLALADVIENQVVLSRVERYINSERTDLNSILQQFLAADDNLGETLCCLAVAGPTDGTHVQFTNLDWHIDTTDLRTHFGFSRCRLINDFSAVGWGLNTLNDQAHAALQVGQPVAAGARVALGAGTGFGVSLCAWRGDHYQPMASEGGHIGFAPTNPEQDRLLAFLRTLYGRVSVERILSGPGLLDLYRFSLREHDRTDPGLLAAAQPAAAITQAGLGRNDAAAIQSLRLFTSIFGQTAGDWALACQATGGLFLAGGIAPKLLPALANGDFLAGFSDKGRYRDWMRQIPVSVVLDPDIGLKGAAVAAVETVQS